LLVERQALKQLQISPNVHLPYSVEKLKATAAIKIEVVVKSN
jgi:hypothetical protein